jgi:RNA recognition motif-containing protein
VADLTFETQEQGQAALEKYNGMLLDDKPMQIRPWDSEIDLAWRDPRAGGAARPTEDLSFTERATGNRITGYRTIRSEYVQHSLHTTKLNVLDF